MKDSLKDDRLNGVKAIAEFTGNDLRRTYHLLATGMLPAGKEGNLWIASKRRLREHYTKITSGAIVPPAAE
jgi:hypothetical protein